MKNLFYTWKASLLGAFLIVAFSLPNMFFDYWAVEQISFFGTVISLILVLFNLAFLMFKRKWIYALVSFAILLVSFAFLIVYIFAMFWIYQARPDKFADNLEIPTDIELNIPQYNSRSNDTNADDSIVRAKVDFDIYSSHQPGMYEYDFWIGKTDPGIVYLKAFEITQEYQLSEERLTDESAVSVYNPVDSMIRFGLPQHFTIYEGDWGKPYAARFELWYRPQYSLPERKLAEKIYKIEGWQR